MSKAIPAAPRRLTAVLAILSLLAAGGCAASGPADGPETTANASHDGKPSGNVEWWSWSPDAPLAQKWIAAFEAEYPDIHVTFKQHGINDYDAALRTALAAKSGPDVFTVTGSATSHPAQVFGASAIDATPALAAALGAGWKSKFVASQLPDSLYIDGKLTAIPIGGVASGTLWINKTVFDKYSLRPPTTYDQWKQVCATLTSNGVGCFVQGVGQGAFNIDTLHTIADNVHPGLFAQALKGEAQWTDPDMVKAFGLWKGLFDDDIMQEGALGMQQYPEGNNAFLSQEYAMIMMGTWFAQNAVTETQISNQEAAGVGNPVPFEMIPILFPDIAGTGHIPGMQADLSNALAISTDSDNLDAATLFAVWMATSATGQQEIADSMSTTPSQKDVVPNWDAMNLAFPGSKQNLVDLYTWAGDATEPRVSAIPADLNDAIQIAASTIAGGNATPAEAAQALQNTADSLK
ncbi:MAG: ABC transporter substrate-binding protein [Propionibacteriaceae bacterium]|jgi:ABC-type glycerol-3-phosphate transport system substrate-binding protein|nr:ABC transporter substrate-binding protein [Propionibacteriaceae bacterium]